MNIFSNIGVTELVIILLLALLVVGPERLPEVGRKLGQGLRDLRKAYENLTRDLGPELQSIQKTTQELRESVDSVRSIPQDVVKKVVEAADLDDTIEDLKSVAGQADQVRKTLSTTAKAVQSPVSTAVNAAKGTLLGYPAAQMAGAQSKAERPLSGEEQPREEGVPSGATDPAAMQSAPTAEASMPETAQAATPEERIQQDNESPDAGGDGSENTGPGEHAAPIEEHVES